MLDLAAGTSTEQEAAGQRADEALVLRDVTKSFGSHVAVQACSLSIRRGEIVGLLGASGCGKSTLLNLIAGFEIPDGGTILLRGRPINAVPPHRRNVAMVFQNYAMFPHLTVAQNVAYGLHARKLGRAAIRARVEDMLALLQLSGLGHRYPAQLSGGQRQRVAVARALAIRPDMLLLDEAFSALDRNLREDMQLELSLLLRKLHVTTVLVTHDQREAFALADRIAVMQGGRIAQIGTPEAVYRSPSSSDVLRFLGTSNRLPAELQPDGQVVVGPGFAFTPPGRPELPPGAVQVDIRAEDIALSAAPTAVHLAEPAQVVLRTFLGAQERIVVALQAMQLVVERPASPGTGSRPPVAGTPVFLDFDPALCRLSRG